MSNYYKVLGVSADATREEIQNSYKERASIWHPEKGGSHKVFIEITQAFNVLFSIDERFKYDEVFNPNDPEDTTDYSVFAMTPSNAPDSLVAQFDDYYLLDKEFYYTPLVNDTYMDIGNNGYIV